MMTTTKTIPQSLRSFGKAASPSFLPVRSGLLAMAVTAVCHVMWTDSAQAESSRHPLPHAHPGLLAVSTVPLANAPEVAAATWSQIKDRAFEQRADFNSGVARLEAQLDVQIKELNAKRATLKGNTQAWDFAMKEMDSSRAYLRSMAAEAAKATEETWEDRREKVGLAWERAQDAYGKVKASTTT